MQRLVDPGGTSVLAGLLLLVGCNAIFGIEKGEPAPDEAGAGGTSSGGASGSATSGAGGTATGGRNSGGTDAVGGVAAVGGTDATGGGTGGASTGGTGTGGMTVGGTGGSVGGMAGAATGGNAGGTGTGGMAGAIGTVQYDFEGAGNLDGFLENGDCPTLSISQSAEQHAGTTGSGSMKITLTGPRTTCDALYVRRDSPQSISPGQTISYQAYFPPTSAGTFGWFDLIVEDGAYTWSIYEAPIPTARSTWVTFTYTVPAELLPPVRAIGFDMAVDPGFNGSVYIDDIAW